MGDAKCHFSYLKLFRITHRGKYGTHWLGFSYRRIETHTK